jgi:hypothetical protein
MCTLGNGCEPIHGAEHPLFSMSCFSHARRANGCEPADKGNPMARKNSLVANINRRKRKGTSRPKSRSTVSKKSYREMRQGWPGSKKAKKKTTRKRATKKKSSKKK